MLAAIPFPNLSPNIFSISLFGMEFALRWYAMAYIVGIVIGWRIIVAALRRPALWSKDTSPFSPEQAEDLLTWIVVGVILGGRLGYVFFYQPAYYLQNPLEIPAIWTGGMSFHGGFLGVVLLAYIWTRRNKVALWPLADSLAIAVPPALLLGRVSNFINAELWGRPTDAPWGVIFPGEAAQACQGIIGACARHPSQLYEAALEGLILGAVLLYFAFRRGLLKRQGAATGIFLAGYGMARFAVEFVRQPDAQFVTLNNPLGLAWQVNGYGLTMGQFLSLPMIFVGLFLIRRAFR
ncbi:prolipoprotein diacylglyceryl transferase [Nereida ignava]|uniref:Phosphatidylglycerol--prolipoprotein diacylglyceryl transferase n=1 Tax=Nereida ignava TaxID=282199 RepID=A0A0U1NMT6_9RHOB|nr:prolipoprotein diacylglyceryl transferase [Nereida ignava]CRK76040.1 Prolipoprotein diacylglyceryl transferase [Nereida ignava]SFJ66213.1 Prolipoprotein diacylglyceryl transferase [Nereida ignava DSM 16309]